MNKTNNIVLTILLCFSIVFVVYPIKTNAQLSEWAQSVIDDYKEEYEEPPAEETPPDEEEAPPVASGEGLPVEDPVEGPLEEGNYEYYIGYVPPAPPDPDITNPPPGGWIVTHIEPINEEEPTPTPIKPDPIKPDDEDEDEIPPPPPPSNDIDWTPSLPPIQPPVQPQQVCRCVLRYSHTPCANTCGGSSDTGGGTPSSGGTPSPPPPPPKYSCNRSSWTCYQNSSGPYSSLSSCQSACVEPPCMINYFEFPKRAWVGYSITGKWSASDWCVDCDVTCSPYPECVWKENNIGIGSDEHKFTLEQSGAYTYTLTCYKQGGRDQKQVTVNLEALNLPWWREIIPVLRGSLFSFVDAACEPTPPPPPPPPPPSFKPKPPSVPGTPKPPSSPSYEPPPTPQYRCWQWACR